MKNRHRSIFFPLRCKFRAVGESVGAVWYMHLIQLTPLLACLTNDCCCCKIIILFRWIFLLLIVFFVYINFVKCLIRLQIFSKGYYGYHFWHLKHLLFIHLIPIRLILRPTFTDALGEKHFSFLLEWKEILQSLYTLECRTFAYWTYYFEYKKD